MEQFTDYSMDSDIESRCPAIRRLRKGYVAACQLQPVRPGRRAWVGVYPLHSNEYTKRKGDYRLRVFEVAEEQLINDNDVWDGVMENRADVCVVGEESLLSRIEEFVDPACLGDPQSCFYPV